MVKTVPRKLNCTVLLSNWCEQVKSPKADRGRRSEIKSIMTAVLSNLPTLLPLLKPSKKALEVPNRGWTIYFY